MTNPYYNPTGTPGQRAILSSAAMRGELALIGEGFDDVDGAIGDVSENAPTRLASYTLLRAYAGAAVAVRLTTAELWGVFERDDADTTSADNGGTIIVDTLSRRWKRRYQGSDIFADWFGAKGDDSTDCANAIDACEAACTAGQTVKFKTGTYRISRALTYYRARMRWVGDGTIFKYTGANTTNNILTFGNPASQIHQCHFEGFRVTSDTTMTAGSGIRFANICRTTVYRVVPDGQDGNRKLWDGIHFDAVDQVCYGGFVIWAQNDGLKVNGTVGAGAKAGLFLDDFKIGGCGGAGVHVAGGFGGIYLGKGDVAVNGVNLLVDESDVAEANREVLVSGMCSLDYAQDAGEASIVVDQSAANFFLTLQKTWVASSLGHGVWIKNAPGARIECDIYGYNNAGDGIRVDDAAAYVNVGGIFRDNGGWDVNPNVASNGVAVDALLYGGGLGGINPTYVSAATLSMTGVYAHGVETLFDIECGRSFVRDAQNYWTLVSGNPVFNYDTNDFFKFDRSTNEYRWEIGGAEAVSVGPGYFNVANRGDTIYKHFTGTANGSGLVSVSHGDSGLPTTLQGAQGFWRDAGGTTYPLTMSGVNGSLLEFTAVPAAAGRPYFVRIWYGVGSTW